MSETLPIDSVEALNEVGLIGEDELNAQLMSHYAFLTEKFGPMVRQEQRVYADNEGKHHEYILQVGEPMYAHTVMGSGRTLDVGGPSPYGSLKTIRGTFKPNVVSNIVLEEGVHDVVDVHSLHYPDESFSAVVGMNLPGRNELPDRRFSPTTRSAFIEQAHRILEPGGWMIMTAATREDVTQALEQGFRLEAGNGAVIAGITMTEKEPLTSRRLFNNLPRLVMEILLHK